MNKTPDHHGKPHLELQSKLEAITLLPWHVRVMPHWPDANFYFIIPDSVMENSEPAISNCISDLLSIPGVCSSGVSKEENPSPNFLVHSALISVNHTDMREALASLDDERNINILRGVTKDSAAIRLLELLTNAPWVLSSDGETLQTARRVENPEEAKTALEGLFKLATSAQRAALEDAGIYFYPVSIEGGKIQIAKQYMVERPSLEMLAGIALPPSLEKTPLERAASAGGIDVIDTNEALIYKRFANAFRGPSNEAALNHTLLLITGMEWRVEKDDKNVVFSLEVPARMSEDFLKNMRNVASFIQGTEEALKGAITFALTSKTPPAVGLVFSGDDAKEQIGMVDEKIRTNESLRILLSDVTKELCALKLLDAITGVKWKFDAQTNTRMFETEAPVLNEDAAIASLKKMTRELPADIVGILSDTMPRGLNVVAEDNVLMIPGSSITQRIFLNAIARDYQAGKLAYVKEAFTTPPEVGPDDPAKARRR
jgi:hypothetical protein